MTTIIDELNDDTIYNTCCLHVSRLSLSPSHARRFSQLFSDSPGVGYHVAMGDSFLREVVVFDFYFYYFVLALQAFTSYSIMIASECQSTSHKDLWGGFQVEMLLFP